LESADSVDDVDIDAETTLALFYDMFSSGNISKTAESCALTIFGSLSEYSVDVCSIDKLEDQYNGESDTVNCGVNSVNKQGCLAGFYQPSSNLNSQAPGSACPEGYWCPSGFTCIIPCPYGSLCKPSVMDVSAGASLKVQAKSKCRYKKGVVSPKSPEAMFDTAISTCSAASENVTYVCPGMSKVPLCPAGFYCPTSTEIYECPASYYCPTGTYTPQLCRAKIGCPNKGQAYPLVFEPVLSGLAILSTVCLIVYTAVSRHKEKKRVIRREQQRIAIVERVEARKALENAYHRNAYHRQEAVDDGAGDDGDDTRRQSEAGLEIQDSTPGELELVTWLFLGCDQQAQLSVIVVSTIALCFSLWALFSGQPVSDDVVWVALGISCLGIVASCVGYCILFFKNSAKLETQMKARGDSEAPPPLAGKRPSTMLKQKTSMFNIIRSSTGSSPSESRTSKATRSYSISARMESVELLGSLKQKTETRINLEVDKLGLRLNSNKRVVLAGVDGKIDAGGVTAIMASLRGGLSLRLISHP